MNHLQKPEMGKPASQAEWPYYIFYRRVGDVESVERLTPVAVNETAKQEAFMLIREGYVQATQVLTCPYCNQRFLLLLDSRDRPMTGHSAAEKQAADYFRTMIAAQHLTNHPLETPYAAALQAGKLRTAPCPMIDKSKAFKDGSSALSLA